MLKPREPGRTRWGGLGKNQPVVKKHENTSQNMEDRREAAREWAKKNKLLKQQANAETLKKKQEKEAKKKQNLDRLNSDRLKRLRRSQPPKPVRSVQANANANATDTEPASGAPSRKNSLAQSESAASSTTDTSDMQEQQHDEDQDQDETASDKENSSGFVNGRIDPTAPESPSSEVGGLEKKDAIKTGHGPEVRDMLARQSALLRDRMEQVKMRGKLPEDTEKRLDNALRGVNGTNRDMTFNLVSTESARLRERLSQMQEQNNLPKETLDRINQTYEGVRRRVLIMAAQRASADVLNLRGQIQGSAQAPSIARPVAEHVDGYPDIGAFQIGSRTGHHPADSRSEEVDSTVDEHPPGIASVQSIVRSQAAAAIQAAYRGHRQRRGTLSDSNHSNASQWGIAFAQVQLGQPVVVASDAADDGDTAASNVVDAGIAETDGYTSGDERVRARDLPRSVLLNNSRPVHVEPAPTHDPFSVLALYEQSMSKYEELMSNMPPEILASLQRPRYCFPHWFSGQ